jgi:hypothetical protein
MKSIIPFALILRNYWNLHLLLALTINEEKRDQLDIFCLISCSFFWCRSSNKDPGVASSASLSMKDHTGNMDANGYFVLCTSALTLFRLVWHRHTDIKDVKILVYSHITGKEVT